MDHSYRAAQAGGNNGHKPSRHRPGFSSQYPQAEPEPLPTRDDANSRIFAFVDDLFFLAKIQETARKLNVKVEFVKNDKDLTDRLEQNGEEKPSLIIFDLNNANAKPLTLIPKLKSKLKKGTSIIGFLSHVQGDLKQKAHEVGCDMVLPRSAFSQNLPQLLRRHGAPEEEDESDGAVRAVSAFALEKVASLGVGIAGDLHPPFGARAYSTSEDSQPRLSEVRVSGSTSTTPITKLAPFEETSSSYGTGKSLHQAMAIVPRVADRAPPSLPTWISSSNVERSLSAFSTQDFSIAANFSSKAFRYADPSRVCILFRASCLMA